MLYKKAEVRAKYGLKRIKKDSFRKFAEGLTKFTNPTYLWRKVKCFKNRFNFVDNANEYDSKKVERIGLMIENLCPPWVAVGQPSFENVNQDVFLDLSFSEAELEYAISNVNLKSRAGINCTNYLIISRLPAEAKNFLLDLYNDILDSRSFPEEWRKYEIFFIPKGDGLKYRPISLAPCLCKVLEKMINCRINWWMEYYEKFPSSQFGFRKSKSCIDNLSLLHVEIIKAFNRDAALPTVFLDIKSAYDNVLADVLIEKLKLVGFSSNMLAFVYNFVSSRSLSFKFGDIQKVRWALRRVVSLVLCCMPYTSMISSLPSVGIV